MTDTIEYREFEIRETDAEKREISGIAIPYDTTTHVRGFAEQVVKGAFGNPGSVPLFHGHGHLRGDMPIGVVHSFKDESDGLHIRARLSETPAGNEAWQLVKDGALRKMSIGFEPLPGGTEARDGVLTRTAARLLEVSLTGIPAYPDASVTEHRTADPNTQEEEPVVDLNEMTEFVEVRDGLADMERRMAVLTAPPTDPAGSQFRTAGEYLKGLAAGDEGARALFRSYTGATLADADGTTRPGWINETLKLVQENRPLIGLFRHVPLPDTGNSIEYPFVSGTTGDVAEQAAEGDDLSYLEVALDTATAPVKTYGGYSELSRQTIERSDLSYLDAVLRFQAISYAKVTEARVRTILATSAAVTSAGGPNQIDLTASIASATAAQWIGAVIDAAAAIEDNSLGLTGDLLLLSRDVYKVLATKVDGSQRPIFGINGDGTNTLGQVGLLKVGGNIGDLPMAVGPKLASNTAMVVSREALVTAESAGAPVRLQDENIINLSKQFSLYGYLSAWVADVKGLSVIRDVTP